MNGIDSVETNWPWIAYLLMTKNGKSELCGGIFINSNWLLTAYHCIKSYQPSNMNIVAGVLDGQDGSTSTGIPPSRGYIFTITPIKNQFLFFLTDTRENDQKWTRVFSTRR